MPATTRTRIDWQPGKAALDALQRAKSVLPHLRQQELIDALIVTGLSALVNRWQPPPLLGTDRDRWRLPVNLTSLGSTSAAVRGTSPATTVEDNVKAVRD